MNLPAGYTSRPAAADDLDAVVALVETVQVDSMGAAEHARDELTWFWHLPHVDLPRDTVMVEAGGNLAGYGDALWDPASPGPLVGSGVVH
nr:hypothetical protein [Actinomycetota bacterium]